MNTKLNQFLMYDELPLWSAPFGLLLLETIRLRKNMTILDLGSGGGFPMLEIAERAGSSCKIYGIDPSPDAFFMIREKISLKNIFHAEIVKAAAEELPFPDEHVDLITGNNGLNNVSNALKVVQECYRTCKPGGQAVFTMNLPHTLIEFYDMLEGVFLDFGKPEAIIRMKEHMDEKRKPAEYWKKLFTDTGFVIHEMLPDGFKIHFNDGYSFFQHYFIRTAFLPSWQQFADDEVLFRTIERINALAEETGGFGVSVPFICFDLKKP